MSVNQQEQPVVEINLEKETLKITHLNFSCLGAVETANKKLLEKGGYVYGTRCFAIGLDTQISFSADQLYTREPGVKIAKPADLKFSEDLLLILGELAKAGELPLAFIRHIEASLAAPTPDQECRVLSFTPK